MKRNPLLLAMLLLLGAQFAHAQYQISGELKTWHKVTITFDGPNTSEDANPNPFTDYRLNVTFSKGNKRYVVPGYYAADGNAANTGANSGNKWRVHFAPDETGTWQFEASFRRGNDVALSDNPNAGEPISFDGASGDFNITQTDKSGRDHRGKGRLQYVGEPFLRFAETGEYFLKIGADAPENFLAYDDFDNTPNNGNRRKDWGPHIKDWNSGDPTWQNGKGKGIIGAINYLAAAGQNAFSFLTMNIAGDDRNVFPYISDRPADRLRMDASKLDQWEVVLEHADKLGLYLHFKTQEQENDQLLDGGSLGDERKLYYRELIARFSHHLALNWNIGEENTNSESQQKQFAQYFYDHDPYRHNVVIHTFPGQHDNVYSDLVGNQSKYTGASLQVGWSGVHKRTLEWVTKSRNSGKPWIVANDEQGSANTGVPHDAYTGSPSQDDVRKATLWGHLMASGAGVEYYFGYRLPNSDLTCEDYRSRSNMWRYNRYAHQFFTQHVPFWETENHNELIGNGNDSNDKFCLAKPGETYVIYLANGGSTQLDLKNNTKTFEVAWFNPRQGGGLQQGSTRRLSGGGKQSIGNPPSSPNQDWVVLVTANGIDCPPAGTACDDGDPTTSNDTEDGNCNCAGEPNSDEEEEPSCDGFEEQDGLLVMEAENLNAPSPWLLETDLGATNDKYIRFDANNQYRSPGPGKITVTFKINKTGRYGFIWRMRQSGGYRSDEANDSWVNFPDARFIGVNNGKDKEFNSSIKIFGNARNSFGWSARGDVNHVKYNMFVEFDQPGEYTMVLHGRSEGHQLDRIVLYHSSVGRNQATNNANPETKCDGNDEGEGDDEEDEDPCAGNQAPKVDLVQPANNATYDVGQDIDFRANVSDPDGQIEQVVLYAGDEELGIERQDPYTWTWENAPAGKYELIATATDNCGAMSSSSISIEVINESCPEQGTPCDDGNPQTIDDQQDGNCNCVGTYPGDEDAQGVWLEAECAAVGAQWTTVLDEAASGGTYMLPPAGKTRYNNPTTQGEDKIVFRFNLSEAGTYRIYARTRTTGGDDDSFWVRVNGGDWIKWNSIHGGSATNGFEWSQVGVWKSGNTATPLDFNLQGGPNLIEFGWREPDLQFDKLFITKDSGAPQGRGNKAGNCDDDGSDEEDDEESDEEDDSEDDGEGGEDENFVTIWLEAECATVGADWITMTDPEAANNKYLLPPDGEISLNKAPDDPAKIVSFDFEVPQDGTYRIYARTMTTFDSDDSFWVRVNGGKWQKWNKINFDSYGKQYQWAQVGDWSGGDYSDPLSFDLTSGMNRVEFGRREPNARLDKILITLEEEAPMGKGESAENCDNGAAGDAGYWLEAECAQVGGNWTLQESTDASNGQYLMPPNVNAYNNPPTKPVDMVTFRVDLEEAGTYNIFTRARTSFDGDDSFWVRVNGGKWQKWNKVNLNNYNNGFQWDQVGDWSGGAQAATAVTFQMQRGTNTIQFGRREPRTLLDKIFITKTEELPEGKGALASNCDEENAEVADIWVEAECGQVGNAWTVVEDLEASSERYLLPPEGQTRLNKASEANKDIVSYTVDIKQAGVYYIFTRARTSFDGDDSFWVRVNGGKWQKWNKVNYELGEGFQWDQVGNWTGGTRATPVSFDMVSGENLIEIGWREPGVRLDKLLISRVKKAPEGMGDDAFNCFDGTVTSAQDLIARRDALTLYPNPTAGQLTVQVDIHLAPQGRVVAQVVNTLGQTVLIREIDQAAQQFQLDCSQLDRGTYILLLQTQQGLLRSEFVKYR